MLVFVLKNIAHCLMKQSRWNGFESPDDNFIQEDVLVSQENAYIILDDYISVVNDILGGSLKEHSSHSVEVNDSKRLFIGLLERIHDKFEGKINLAAFTCLMLHNFNYKIDYIFSDDISFDKKSKGILQLTKEERMKLVEDDYDFDDDDFHFDSKMDASNTLDKEFLFWCKIAGRDPSHSELDDIVRRVITKLHIGDELNPLCVEIYATFFILLDKFRTCDLQQIPE